MNTKEKIAKIEDLLEEDEGTITPETVLADLDSWDSMSKLSLIVMMDDEFGKTLSGDTIKSFTTINDILKYME